MEKVDEVILFYDRLCQERPGGRYWSENIIDASLKLDKNIEHANFYNFLANPEQYRYQENLKTLGDLSEGELQKINNELEALAISDQTTQIFKNGTDRVYLIGHDDEKADF